MPPHSKYSPFSSISKWEALSSPVQSHVNLDVIKWLILVKNSWTMATTHQCWNLCHCTRMWAITVCSYERGRKKGFSLHFVPSLALPPITWHWCCVWEVMHDLMARFWKGKYLNFGFTCFCSLFRCQVLQRDTWGIIVYEDIPFMRLQFIYFLLGCSICTPGSTSPVFLLVSKHASK